MKNLLNIKLLLGTLACLVGTISSHAYAFQGQVKTIKYLVGTDTSTFQLPDIQPAGGHCEGAPLVGAEDRVYQEGLYLLNFDSTVLSLTDMYLRQDFLSPVDCAVDTDKGYAWPIGILKFQSQDHKAKLDIFFVGGNPSWVSFERDGLGIDLEFEVVDRYLD